MNFSLILCSLSVLLSVFVIVCAASVLETSEAVSNFDGFVLHEALNTAIESRDQETVLKILNENKEIEINPSGRSPLSCAYVLSEVKMSDMLLSHASEDFVREIIKTFYVFDVADLYEMLIKYESRLKLIDSENCQFFLTSVFILDDAEALDLIFSLSKPSIEDLIRYLGPFSYCIENGKCSDLIVGKILESNEEHRVKALDLAVRTQIDSLIGKLNNKK